MSEIAPVSLVLTSSRILSENWEIFVCAALPYLSTVSLLWMSMRSTNASTAACSSGDRLSKFRESSFLRGRRFLNGRGGLLRGFLTGENQRRNGFIVHNKISFLYLPVYVFLISDAVE